MSDLEQHGLIDYYKAIERTSDQMLAAAQAEDWDRVVRLEGACAVLIAQLRFKSRDADLAPDERKEKARIMQRILRTDAEIRCLAEPWLADLAQIIDRSSAAPTH
ncbi:MAG: flagellar protein FliT [Hydrogenophaga sp.]|jgi:flagellar protein FliT|uniref:flagellar protein FliT n=1 Tax=Hydrogenophaga sp. TaxID=1904254 RepID=UPI0016969DA6|nr:flagellar protein FliT [Hydrogenophaga sp.]NIM41981.1 flagellar protein FliT [Hydrogenophaga sp.]NIN27284.1 flagellar protein FliT [Hydrogenophaga sp.]NIN31985.1 flagellar protein FliT [Hydrogenophaga sp.]NIN56378.1 flagellar protein FliT [Hydrogenophaga sp.]NIO52358.1 flagellar protein FliT [Hydrogenophaga sp.]